MANDTRPTKLENDRYSWDTYGWHGGFVMIDIAEDAGSYMGCAHPGEIELTRADLLAMLADLDAEVARHEAPGR